MKISVLCENTSCSKSCLSEHGLSLYIETDRHKILFDTGQTDAFLKNAQTMGIDLSEADTAVISHGHYDHGGGLKAFLRINSGAPVYINEHAFEKHYNGERYNGLDASLSDSERIVFTQDSFIIDDELSLFTLNDMQKKYPSYGANLNALKNGRIVPDDFIHEQYLGIRENGKNVLISGCSHKGILNIMSALPETPCAVVGGFHFMNTDVEKNADELEKAAGILASYNTVFYTCHCTGTAQYEYLKKRAENIEYISSGQVFSI